MFEPRPRKRQASSVKNLIIFRVTPKEFDAIADMAEEMHMTKTDFMKYCVRLHIEQKDK